LHTKPEDKIYEEKKQLLLVTLAFCTWPEDRFMKEKKLLLVTLAFCTHSLKIDL
jgi:hypothetical protein